MSVTIDRRRSERLRLPRPILGGIDGCGALILDLGFEGVLVEHYGSYQPGDSFELTLMWEGREIAYRCTVAHSRVVRVASAGSDVSHTGALLVSANPESEERLGRMIFSFIGEVIEAQRANSKAASGSGGSFLTHLGDARRFRTQGYLVYRYRDGVWSHTSSNYPLQPQNGFTVAAYEEEEELRLLCDAYAAADDDGRTLIRMVAELSARSARPPV